MTDRTLIVDNDVFVLLAAAGKLERAVSLLGFDWGQARRLPALPFMLRRCLSKPNPSKSFGRYKPDHLTAALALADSVPEMPFDQQNVPFVDALAPLIAADAPLYNAVATTPTVWLQSADALAMRKVCGAAELAGMVDSIRGRVVSLESVAYALAHADGYHDTATAFQSVAYAERKINCLFPDGEPEGGMGGIPSYLRSLCSQLGPGFLHCPPCPNAPATRICVLV